MPLAPMLPGETLGQYHAAGAEDLARRRDEVWAQQQTEALPLSWIKALLRKWGKDRSISEAEANAALRKTAGVIRAAQHAGLSADANDDDIVREAAAAARATEAMLAEREQHAHAAAQREGRQWPEDVRLLALWDKACGWLERLGLGDWCLRARGLISAKLRRLTDERWWRRMFRRLHARAVECTARTLGLVSKRAGCYVSDDGLKLRAGQRARNERALESVTMVNAEGDDYTLAELAAKSVGNREVRRCELMTRIAGFEVIAKQCGHEALFVTVTCPSRMHRMHTVGEHAVAENKKWDGTQPKEAQQYLSDQWGKFRSACERWGVELYGFRIAEPNHDGTPHWHALLFMPPKLGRGLVRTNTRLGKPYAIRVAVRYLRRYFLHKAGVAGDRTEKGARRHRVSVEKIDWSRGSAAGYVAKYVSKNIDGYRVEKDLYGNDTLTSSKRVDAWASIHSIRQFQQIGGAPVGVWRELRRLHPEQAAVSETIAAMTEACNVSSDAAKEAEGTGNEIKHQRTAAHGWATYLELQGGHRVKRKDLRVRLLKEDSGELGRYGDPLAPRTVGIVSTEVRREEVAPFGIMTRPMVRHVTVQQQVESQRSTWVQVAKDAVKAMVETLRAAVRPTWQAVGPPTGKPVHGERDDGPAPPWSSVNNCTRGSLMDRHPEPLFAPPVRRAHKLRRWYAWGGAGP